MSAKRLPIKNMIPPISILAITKINIIGNTQKRVIGCLILKN